MNEQVFIRLQNSYDVLIKVVIAKRKLSTFFSNFGRNFKTSNLAINMIELELNITPSSRKNGKKG